jgi:hypothetical protein
MDLASVCAAFGLSAASGLNAWLPLFAGALLNRLDVVELAAPFDDLSGTGWLVVLGVLTAADFIGDKIPAVDHVLHAVGSVIAPISGAVMFTGQTGVDTDVRRSLRPCSAQGRPSRCTPAERRSGRCRRPLRRAPATQSCR